jgi:hypothetical protein
MTANITMLHIVKCKIENNHKIHWYKFFMQNHYIEHVIVNLMYSPMKLDK